MTQSFEGAFRSASAAIEHLVRTIVREEVRRHLGPEADHLINIRTAPMSARKLRALIRVGTLRGFKHGNDMYVSATDFRSFIEGRPVVAVGSEAQAPVDTSHDSTDDVRVMVGLAPADPQERRAFELRLAERRAGGGERAESLRHAEAERVRYAQKAREDAERRARRDKRKRS